MRLNKSVLLKKPSIPSRPAVALSGTSIVRNDLWILGYSTVLILSISQRVMLALINREANDDHFEVIQLLSTGLRSLSMVDCHECFHPKLYYVFCVWVFQLFQIQGQDAQIVVAQFVNCSAGLLTLLFIWYALYERRAGSLSMFLTFGWVALNPGLIGINAQASNDSFSILFTTLAILFTYRFLRHERSLDFFFGQLALGLAIVSKGTSWPGAIAILIGLAARTFIGGKTRLRYAGFTTICLLVCAASLKLGDYDFESYDLYANLGRDLPLHFLERTEFDRPGVISIAESFMTFRFVDLLRNPTCFRVHTLEPIHLTSLWTQLYGRLHAVQFDYHPVSWHRIDGYVKNLNRSIFVVAVVWLFVLALGFMKSIIRTVRGVRRFRLMYIAHGEYYFHLMIAIGYLAFIILFTASYREFAAMKAVYIFPSFLAFASIMQDGIQVVLRVLRNHSWKLRTFLGASVLLWLLYLLNIQLLVSTLGGLPFDSAR